MHRRNRALRALAAAVTSVIVASLHTAPARAAGATHPSNRPTPIADRENGRLHDNDLIYVTAGCAVARAAGPSLHRLFLIARASGEPIGARDCYRPIDEQVAVGQTWTARGNSACAAQPRYDADGRPIGTSMHGWGKATDFSDSGRTMTFTAPGYHFLKREAGRVGWNHPGWAEPGGSACPEAWHWEWVGDGGTMAAPPIRADVVALLPAPDDEGYAAVTGLGALTNRGTFVHAGDARDIPLRWVVIGAASTPSGAGYWLVAADGGIFTFGDATFHGSTGAAPLNAPIVAMASTPSGDGYWLVAADGGIFTFGDATFHGSTGALDLADPIVSAATTPSGAGYWLVASDGGVFTFGDARFHGSAAALELAAPVVGVTPVSDGSGYWLTGADGGIFTYGSAPFAGAG